MYRNLCMQTHTHTIVDVRSLFLFQWTKKNARDLSLRGPLKYVCNFGLNIYMWKYFQFLLIALNSSDKYCASRRSEICHKHAIKLRVFEWFEPVAVAKCVIILQTLSLSLCLCHPRFTYNHITLHAPLQCRNIQCCIYMYFHLHSALESTTSQKC